MADPIKAAVNKAQSDHAYGQSAPNLSNVDHSARTAYESERLYLKQQEEANKPK